MTSARVVTESDFRRLSSLSTSVGLAARLGQHVDALSRALSRAVVVPDVAPSVVTMNSRVAYCDEHDRPFKITLVYPWDANPGAGRVSVCSPLGAALLGAREGAPLRWTDESGRAREGRVLSVVFQPEAHGLLHL